VFVLYLPQSNMVEKAERAGFVRSALMLSVATVVSRVLGFIREVIFAALFGATYLTDAFRVAYTIPYMLRRLLGEGSMNAFIVPIYTEQLERYGEEKAKQFTYTVYTFFVIAVGIIVLLLIAIAPWILWLFAPGLARVPDVAEFTVMLMRFMAPYMLLMMTSALIMGVLNSYRVFFWPAMSPIVLNLINIGAMVLICPLFPGMEHSQMVVLAIAVIVGGLGQVAVQFPQIWTRGFRYKPNFEFRNPGVRSMVALMIPALFAIGITRINLIVSSALASLVGPGTITILNYAERLLQLPMGIFGYAISIAIMPLVATYAARGEIDKVRSSLPFSLRLVLLVALPSMIILTVLGLPVTRLVYEHGAFTAADTWGTGTTLIAFATGLPAFIALQVVIPFFYSLKIPRQSVIAALWAMITNLILSFILVWPLGAVGLGLANAAAAYVNVAAHMFHLKHKLGYLGLKQMALPALRLLAVTIVMAAATWGSYILLEQYVSVGRLWSQIICVGGSISIGFAVYIGGLWVSRAQELTQLVARLRERKSRRTNDSGNTNAGE
jgi:putative peptidoglycan lipid II flippase